MDVIKIDIIQAISMMEALCQVKFVIFSTEKDRMEIKTSDPFKFSTYYSEKVATLVQPVIHKVLIVSSDHVCNNVVNTKSSMVTFIKGMYELPKYFIPAAAKHKILDKGTVHAMIRDWKMEKIISFHFQQNLLKIVNLRVLSVECFLRIYRSFLQLQLRI